MGKSFGCCDSSKQVLMNPRHAVESVASSHSAVVNPPHDEGKSAFTLLKAIGKFCGCYPSSEKVVSSPPHEAVDPSSGKGVSSPPHEAVEAECKRSLEEIVQSINGINPVQQIDLLTRCIEDLKRIIKALSEASTSFSSKGIHQSVLPGINIGGQMVDTISMEAEKMKTEEIVEGMGKMAIDALDKIARTHWIFVGLSVVGYALRPYITMKSNVSGCIELLENLADLADDLCESQETGLEGNKKLSKAVHVIIESSIMCLDYINHGEFSRLVN